MTPETDHCADDHDREAGHDADAQQAADQNLHAVHAGVGFQFFAAGWRPIVHQRTPLSSISSEIHINTMMKTNRIHLPCNLPSSREPITAPKSTPAATGAATNGSMSPRMK